MRKVINGKMYDTGTATLIKGYSFAEGKSDYFCEQLYRKKNGEFYLYVEGGPCSKYRDEGLYAPIDNCDIIPKSEEEAKRWVAKHCSGDVYEQVFGPVPE